MSVALLEVLKARYSTWPVDSNNDRSQQRQYQDLQLCSWDLESPAVQAEITAYLEEKLDGRTMSADSRYRDPVVLLTSELQCNLRFAACVGDVAAAVLRELGHDIIFAMGEPSTDGGKPDFVVLQGQYERTILVTGEGKTPSAMAAAAEVVTNPRPQVRKAAAQACTYIRDKGHRYGFLTYLNGTFYIRRMADCQYAFSRVVLPDAQGLTSLQMMTYIILKSMEEGPWRGGPGQDALVAGPRQQQAQGRQQEEHRQRRGMVTRSRSRSAQVVAAGVTGSSFRCHPVAALELTSQVLGGGQMGLVRLARLYGVPCAVKMVDTSKAWELQKFLENEVEAYGLLSALQGDVIPVLEGCGFWNDEGVFFVATSFLDGQHPDASTRAGLPAAEQALRRIHACGWLHGNIKNENILVQGAGGAWKAWYLDLGFSRPSSSADEFAEELADLRAVFCGYQQSDTTGP